MNNAPLDRATFEAIEAYVLERMSSDDRRAFDERLAAEPQLRKELEFARDHIHAIELGGVARSLRAIAAEQVEPATSITGRWKQYIAYAASFAALLAVALWWFARPPLHERLFAEYFTPEPGLPVTMGATDDPAFADAMVYYKEGRYAEALARWNPLLQQEPTNDTLQFYTAMVAMATGELAAAEPALKAVTARNSIFQSRARWYLFLLLIEQGRTHEAQSLGLEQDAVYGERAQRVIQQLSE